MAASVRAPKSCADSARRVATYLADTSAWHWSGRVAGRWEMLLDDNEVATCTPVVLELLVSARGPRDYSSLAADLDALPCIDLDSTVEVAARGIQLELATRSQHRGATPLDVLIAATAATAGLTLLHYDRHYDLIARVTGQPMEWLARRGSLD
jgi:predicted nucleic acid-binding protein